MFVHLTPVTPLGWHRESGGPTICKLGQQSRPSDDKKNCTWSL